MHVSVCVCVCVCACVCLRVCMCDMLDSLCQCSTITAYGMEICTAKCLTIRLTSLQLSTKY